LSLNGGREKTTIMNEIQHIKAYANILHRRFGDRVNLDIQVPLYLYPYECLSLILQPLVENAYTHGFASKPFETGTISISGSMENGTIHLSVIDDGIGYFPKPKENATFGGYGLFNVRERLTFAYGESAGLCIKPGIESGTIATISFPAESELKSEG